MPRLRKAGSGLPEGDSPSAALRQAWERLYGRAAPGALSPDFLRRDTAYRQQADQHGGLSAEARRRLADVASGDPARVPQPRTATPRIKPGSTLLREWHGRTYTVLALDQGFEMAGQRFVSLSEVARHITGAHWSGPRFFGLRRGGGTTGSARSGQQAADARVRSRRGSSHSAARTGLRCAIYTRKSSEEGLEQEFNSLDAQREACEAYIRSQRHEGWTLLSTRYDDGGLSGGSMNRPALQRLLADVASGRVDLVVVYKVDRLTRSLSDFAKIVEVLDAHGASFVSVTQQFKHDHQHGPADAEHAAVLRAV